MHDKPTLGHLVIHLDTVDSTNLYAATELAHGSLWHGAVVVASQQTQGRGQRGRSWESAPGLDLAASFVLQPDGFPAQDQFALSKMAALAVHDVVAQALVQAGLDGDEVRVKWPNDVLVGRSKVAGILIQNEVQGPLLSSSIIGVGLNVNSQGRDSALQATSLLQETRHPQVMDGLLERLCARMQHWWGAVAAHPGEVSQAYAERLWARGRFAEFVLDGAPFMARPLDVDPSGRLLVEDAQGRVAAYGLERLRFVR